jgi:molybdopterin synthase catalytic subunit
MSGEKYLKIECKVDGDKVDEVFREIKDRLMNKFGVKEIDIRHKVGEVWR